MDPTEYKQLIFSEDGTSLIRDSDIIDAHFKGRKKKTK